MEDKRQEEVIGAVEKIWDVVKEFVYISVPAVAIYLLINRYLDTKDLGTTEKTGGACAIAGLMWLVILAFYILVRYKKDVLQEKFATSPKILVLLVLTLVCGALMIPPYKLADAYVSNMYARHMEEEREKLSGYVVTAELGNRIFGEIEQEEGAVSKHMSECRCNILTYTRYNTCPSHAPLIEIRLWFDTKGFCTKDSLCFDGNAQEYIPCEECEEGFGDAESGARHEMECVPQTMDIDN